MKYIPFNYEFLKKVNGLTTEAFLQEFVQEQLDELINSNFLYVFNNKVCLAVHGQNLVDHQERYPEGRTF